MPSLTATERVLAYHERTKHHLDRYARSLGYLDWETQPDPFRTFAGAESLRLPLRADGVETTYGDLYRPGAIPPAAVTLESIATLLELSLGLSAWKEIEGARWALRCNPSSGNLHPTEGYLLTAARPGLKSGLHHYVSRDHLLERRGVPDGAAGRRLDEALGADRLLVGISSIPWREAWKYGERAYRYTQHDAGHALAAVRYAAAALGWSARRLERPGDADVEALLGINAGFEPDDPRPPDPEFPDALLLVGPGVGDLSDVDEAIPLETLQRVVAGLTFIGRAEPPSTATVEWEAIDDVIGAAAQGAGSGPSAFNDRPAEPSDRLVAAPGDATPAARIIRQRRSAVRLDGRTGLNVDIFYRMLGRLVQRPGVPPWDVSDAGARIHPAFFVHRVTGLEAGLYLLVRRPGAGPELRSALNPAFEWQRPPECPAGIEFYRLEAGDFRDVSALVSCHQEIAADGAFSLGMLAEFDATIRGPSAEGGGAWWYPRLFQEAGLLGHVLYLEAEAAGIRGTGIGCFFDDAFHDRLGLRDDRYQSLYHFTAGGPVEDARLATHEPYAHRAE